MLHVLIGQIVEQVLLLGIVVVHAVVVVFLLAGFCAIITARLVVVRVLVRGRAVLN